MIEALEKQELDMTSLMLETYNLADMIKNSRETADYLYWKQRVEEDEEIQLAVRQFQRHKDLFEECERFGHFHPEYHHAMDRAKEAERELERFEPVKAFKSAEEALDQLLYDVSETIARAVSEEIKVPGNHVLPEGGCGSGGSCKCG